MSDHEHRPEARPPSNAAVVTVSDGVSKGVRDDVSGRAVAALLEASGFEVARREVVPDERDRIEALLHELTGEGLRLVVTTGGTGLGPRDVTPEAVQAVIDRGVPGLGEEMRAAGRGSTPFAALSRSLAGSIGSVLIVSLPGSERGATESLRAILPALPHALELLAGHTVHGAGDAAVEAGHRAEHPHSDWNAEGSEEADPAPGGSIVDELLRRRAAGEEVVLGTAVAVRGDPPCNVGQKVLLGPGGALAGTLGCAEFDDSAVADAPRVLVEGRPATATYTHELGSVDVFLEPYRQRPRLVVFSATPVALQLLRWAPALGLEPVLVESRAERITPEHRAAASVASAVDEIALGPDTAAIHTDHDAPGVADSVATLLRSPAHFIGVMGSTRHVGPHVERLRELGFGPEDLARVRTPVGIDIGARTAEEIALSMLAGVVADRRGAGGGWLDRRPPADQDRSTGPGSEAGPEVATEGRR